MEENKAYEDRIKKLEAENKRLRSLLDSHSDVSQIGYLEAIIHSLPDIVFLIDEKGTYLDILTDKEDLLYKDLSFMLNKTFREVLPAYVADKALAGIRKVQATGNPTIIEYQLSIADELKWFEGPIARIVGSKDERYVFLVMDITERKNITRLVETSQFKLRRAQEIARLAYFEWNLGTNKASFSEEAKALFQIDSVSDFEMNDYFNFLEIQDQKAVKKGLKEYTRKKGAFEYEYRTAINGEERVHLIHCELMTESDDTRVVFGIIQDLTDIRNLETQHIRKTQEQNAMLMAIPDMMFIQDSNGIFLDFHSPQGQMQNLLMGPSDFIGKKSIEVLPADIAAANHAKIRQVLRTNQHVIHEYQMQINDRTAHFEARMVPGGNGEVLSIVREVTARKQAEQELVKAKLIAEESDRLKSAFLANMSHEIRTPMNGVIGFAELLLQEEIPNDEKQEYFNIIEKNSHQLLQLIDDIIDVSKIEANLLKLNSFDFNINVLLKDLERVYQKELDMSGKDISLKFDGLPDQNQAQIKADKSRLMQVLQNLISNAIKFTEAGEISVELHKKDNFLVFSVKDTGMGIPEMAKRHIFERFRRLDNPADKIYRGTGLGLAVSKGLVELMGGEINVHSVEGEGSTFTFTLPHKRGTEQNDNFYNLNEWEEFASKHVLIVEDEDTSYHYLASMLKKKKISVLRAFTGYQAIELVKNNPVDLILMDIQLPELNGYDATRYIKKIAPDIPVIATTAFALADDEQKALDAGCDSYVSKPISSYTLFKKVKALLG
ncbi:Aerobic respiration control sensor protein ArcB [Salinivirga cyanobacteriivorans]|uniref:Sensory/regulatory protein RpfC n=1 Tax=Salinivirga cyanobacteriivorans TaxID=1307839 RepID=A0A0S2HXI3_9BACT|nr:ATP-binding protein [Salinivirga cyanobacteriivorans]ALO14787.1 Aerobic respiration control sensor protein ArcB [Salinivirga cyanobacteriivorans]